MYEHALYWCMEFDKQGLYLVDIWKTTSTSCYEAQGEKSRAWPRALSKDETIEAWEESYLECF